MRPPEAGHWGVGASTAVGDSLVFVAGIDGTSGRFGTIRIAAGRTSSQTDPDSPLNPTPPGVSLGQVVD